MSNDTLLEELEKKELWVFDFQDSLVPGEIYEEYAEKYLKGHLLSRNIRPRRLFDALRLKNHQKYPVEKRVEMSVNAVEKMDEEKAYKFGEILSGFVRYPIEWLISMYPKKNKAIVTIDDERVVQETANKLGIHTRITNYLIAESGKLTKVLKSVGSGVQGWSGDKINNAEKKWEAFMTVVNSYGLNLSQVAYFCDDDPAEEKIKENLKREGGLVIDNYKLLSFLLPTTPYS